MTERSGIDALDAGFRAELGPPVEELNALNVSPERMPVKDLLWSATWLQGEVKRLRCTDPIECGHEAALGQAQAEVERLTAELGTAKAVMYRALKDGVEHEEVLFLIRRYLDVYPGATTAFPSTAEEGEG